MSTDLREQLQASLSGSYTVERELGGGGMSRVFVATETALGRKVVVKVLLPELAAGVSVDRFRREIQLAAQLQHACIVPLLSAGVSGDLPYYTMPFVEGESLRARLAREGELPVGEVVRILHDVAGAVSYAHEHGIVHRDIKPDNVLLTKHHALVVDFGVAKAVSAATNPGSSLTSLGIALGTPAYMSPEQAAADPKTDHRADLYALGAMAYEMLTGQHVFPSRSPQAMLAAHATEPPVPVTTRRSAVPPLLATLVMRCLEKHAADRPQSADEVLVALDALATPSGGLQPTGAIRVERPSVRARWRLAGAAGLAILGVVLGARFVTRRPPRDPNLIALSPFVNKSNDPAVEPLLPLLSDRLQQGFAEAGVTTTVGLAGSGSGARRAGTSASGAVLRLGDTLEFSASLRDEASGEVIREVGPIRAPLRMAEPAINELSQRATGAIAMMRDEQFGFQGAKLGPPPTYAAYREFHQAEGFYYADQPDSAWAHYARAVALDSTFSWALLRFVGLAVLTGRNVDGELTVVGKRRGRLTPFEEHYLDLTIAMQRGEIGAAYAAAREMTLVAPRSDWAAFIRGWLESGSGRWRGAIATLERLDPASGALRGRNLYYEFLTVSWHQLGDHVRELAAAERGRRQYPDLLALRDEEIAALAALGRTADVDARIAESLALRASPDISPADVMLHASWELLAHGDSAHAVVLAKRAVAWIEDRPAAVRGADRMRETRGLALRVAGDLAAARAVAESLAAEHPDSVFFLGALGVIAARQGDRARADALSERLAVIVHPLPPGVNVYFRAEIAAELGELDRAVQLLFDALAQGNATALRFDADPSFGRLRSYPPYKDLVRPKE